MYLTVDTTGVCDLRCPGMCYYHPGIDPRRKPVPVEAFQAAIQSAHEELALGSLIFAGKEPLQNAPLLVQIARFAGSLPRRDFAIGFVTNGRGIGRNWGDLEELVQDGHLDFLDISLDSGIAAQHDAIRGVPGTFARASAALERIAQEWPDVRLGTTSVLRADNGEGILELLRGTARFNRHFFVTPIQPPPFTKTPPLGGETIRAFLHALRTLMETTLRGAGVEVTVSLLGLHLREVEADGFFSWGELREDAQGQIHTLRDIGGNQFVLQLQVLPETGWRTGRITHTGAYLPNAHFFQAASPEDFAVGYIQQEPLPVLYRRALAEDGILAAMFRSREGHACQKRPCWNHCFGGLAGAEHSFVSGTPLERQPALCLEPFWASPSHAAAAKVET